ncbi:zinc finger CCCH domain-containing protein 18-like isoform X3 [Humulus lupulus]|uniref:zinc finger CCCH domain-containing protein 18-like isoform X3 n=1 Tax=Humulus lupulus TaxID=3486 RepID=UPI002B402ABC|nr:zinc finger CCCH domain-containing protein 18-like isoform X3 [Humulus lupulus]
MMDFPESTKILFNRIQELEPENVTKIIGYLLLQDYGDQELLWLASAPEHLIHQVILKAKTELQQLASKSASTPISPSINPTSGFSPFSSAAISRPKLSSNFQMSSPYWDPQVVKKQNPDFLQMGFYDSSLEHENQYQFLSLEDQMEQINSGLSGVGIDSFYPDAGIGGLNGRTSRRLSSLCEIPVKTCHYYNKGFCKHGSSCRYSHGQVIPESFSQAYDSANEDHLFSPGSLEKLELEIIELLKSRRGNPVSIASLPAMYYEKYGKYLQADGYLTESQRHGKAGYSLTKLLARLKNSIRLIDSRPHGQHALILAEDSAMYMDHRNEKTDPGPIVSGSRQIYLTFPAESTFTEEDVSIYFNSFGPVEDVRIPCQQRRMFGFVTFASADTVRVILAKGNPHFVCGARVLVKPYREKSKLVDRKYSDRTEAPAYYSSHYSDLDSEFQSIARGFENSRMIRKQLMEQERALELETVRLREKPMNDQSYFGYSMDDRKLSEGAEGQFNLPSSEQFTYLFDVFNCGSTSDDKFKHTDTNADQEGQALNLPDSPFASSRANGISTVI